MRTNVQTCRPSHRRNNPHKSYCINANRLRSVKSINDLGVTSNDSLTWSEHINKICKRSNSLLYIFNKAFSNLSPETTRKLYVTYIRPHLEYDSAVWYPILRRDANLLDQKQRRASRLGYGIRRPSYAERVTIMNLELVSRRLRKIDLITTYKIPRSKFKMPRIFST